MKFYTIEPKPYLKERIIAWIVDYSIYFIFCTIFLYVFDEDPQEGQMKVTGLLSLALPLVWFLYFVVTEATNQATPGHDIMKLKVWNIDGSKPSFGTVFKRRFLDFIEFAVWGIPALVCISRTPKHQRLGDLWAGTVVVKKEDIITKEVTF